MYEFTSMLEACRTLVLYKYALDDVAESDCLSGIRNDRVSELCSYSPCLFGWGVFPFMNYASAAEAKFEEVDASLVIGGTYRRYGNETETACDVISAFKSSLDYGEYQQVGELPLYIAREGKNRVRLFQSYNRRIKAEVSKSTIPSPEKLHLHRSVFTKAVYLSCSDPTFVRENEGDLFVLPFPDVTVPFYEAYGVREAGKQWSLFGSRHQRLSEKKIKQSLMSS